MNTTQIAWTSQLTTDGFVVLSEIFSGGQVESFIDALNRAFALDAHGSTLRAEDGSVYGARNLLQLWPEVLDPCKQIPLPAVLAEFLGHDFGLVRVLYFDKPPEQSWALPWHKDMTIAVRDNRLASSHFKKPTKKIGVPHVEAPQWLLENMLTLRVHLDDMTEENGPLKVLPGSHHSGKETGSDHGSPLSILGKRGDVLLMRPLLSHCSNKSNAQTRQNRRVLHYEFAGVRELPDGYVWHDFIPGYNINGQSILGSSWQ